MKKYFYVYILVPVGFLLFFSFSLSENNSNKVKVIILNDNNQRPITILKDDFWTYKEKLDTIEVSGNLLYSFIMKNISLLEKDSIEYTFSIKAAIIIKRDQIIDTLYTDKFFNSWLISEKNYTDKRGELQKMFGNMFLFKYDK